MVNFMKKVLSILFCVLLILSIISFPCSAAEADNIACSSVANSAGSTITLPISYSGEKGIYVARFFVGYDTDVFEYIDIEETLSGTFGYTENNKNGVLTVVMDASDIANYKNNGCILGVKLKIKDTAKNGAYEIKVSGDASRITGTGSDLKAENVALNFENGKVYVVCKEHSFTVDVDNGKKCANCDAVEISDKKDGTSVTVPTTDSNGNTSSIVPGDISTMGTDPNNKPSGENSDKEEEKDYRVVYVVVILSVVAVITAIIVVFMIRKGKKVNVEEEIE